MACLHCCLASLGHLGAYLHCYSETYCCLAFLVHRVAYWHFLVACCLDQARDLTCLMSWSSSWGWRKS